MLTKSSLIADYLLGEILSGRIAPGGKLPSRNQLARQFNCSRTSVERAIASLAASGNITSSRGSGTFAAEPDKNREINELRIVSGVSPFSSVDNFPSFLSDRDLPNLKIRWIKPNCTGENLDLLASPGGAVVWIMPELSQLMIMKHLQVRNISQILINRSFADYDCIATDPAASIREGLSWLMESGRPVSLIAEEPKEWRPYQQGRILAFFEEAVKLQTSILPDGIRIAPYAAHPEGMYSTGRGLWGEGAARQDIFLLDQELAVPLLETAEVFGAKPGRDFRLLSFDTPQILQGISGTAMLRQSYNLFSRELIQWLNRGGTVKNAPFRVRIKAKLVINHP